MCGPSLLSICSIPWSERVQTVSDIRKQKKGEKGVGGGEATRRGTEGREGPLVHIFQSLKNRQSLVGTDHILWLGSCGFVNSPCVTPQCLD